MDVRSVILMVGLSIALPIITLGTYVHDEQYGEEPLAAMSDEMADENSDEDRKVEQNGQFLDYQYFQNGPLYTHWGSNTCSPGSNLVYSGFVGGTWYTVKGGAAQYLCMPMEPEYSEYIPKTQSNSILQTAELQTPSKSIPAFHSLHQNTPVCALCQASGRSAQFMFPGRLTCPGGWNKEYDGYLMTAKYDHRRTEYICMDKQPEVMEDTSKNVNGALLYFVETNSKTDVPDTYVGEKELTCSVCSR
ncbi:uncharacterized protein LOC135824407 [Sycon ciliatum]|uniref:uncharacterized protein LOC135824407 n=1 Tax=Sycon ciliatum TaxID=27933 RepID=UPI0031F6027D